MMHKLGCAIGAVLCETANPALNPPVLVGLSRKSFLGELCHADIENRLSASIAAAMIAVQKGALIVRVHDVKATKDVLRVVKKIVDFSIPN